MIHDHTTVGELITRRLNQIGHLEKAAQKKAQELFSLKEAYADWSLKEFQRVFGRLP